jgi:hypothetical protein
MTLCRHNVNQSGNRSNQMGAIDLNRGAGIDTALELKAAFGRL